MFFCSAGFGFICFVCILSWKERRVWEFLPLFDVLTGCLSEKEAQQIIMSAGLTSNNRNYVMLCLHKNKLIVLSTTWTLTLISHSSISIPFFSLSIAWAWLACHDGEHMLCMIHILYISDMTWSQEMTAPRAAEMLTVHSCGVKMNHMCAIGRTLPVFSERDIQQFCHEHFYGMCLL